MPSVTLTPTSVIHDQVPDRTITGAASIEAALSDSSDASYVSKANTANKLGLWLAMSAASLPAGSIPTRLYVRCRQRMADADEWSILCGGVQVLELGTGTTLTRWTADGFRAHAKDNTWGWGYTERIKTFAGRPLVEVDLDDVRVNLRTFATTAAQNGADIAEVECVIEYNDPPTATIDVVEPVTTARPTVTVGITSPDGDPWTSARCAVVVDGALDSNGVAAGVAGFDPDLVDPDSIVWDSGQIPVVEVVGKVGVRYPHWVLDPIALTAEKAVDTNLVDGVSYHFYGRVWQAVDGFDQGSDWVVDEATPSFDPPVEPTLSTTMLPNQFATRVDLDGWSTVVHASEFDVERRVVGDGGWVPVADRAVLNGGPAVTESASPVTAGARDRFNGFPNSLGWRPMIDAGTGDPSTGLPIGDAVGTGRVSLDVTPAGSFFQKASLFKAPSMWGDLVGTLDAVDATGVGVGLIFGSDNDEDWYSAEIITGGGAIEWLKGPSSIWTSHPDATPASVLGEWRFRFRPDRIEFVDPDGGVTVLVDNPNDEALVAWRETMLCGITAGGSAGYWDDVGWEPLEPAASVIDYECPFGVPVEYRARLWRDDPTYSPPLYAGATGDQVAASEWSENRRLLDTFTSDFAFEHAASRTPDEGADWTDDMTGSSDLNSYDEMELIDGVGRVWIDDESDVDVSLRVSLPSSGGVIGVMARRSASGAVALVIADDGGGEAEWQVRKLAAGSTPTGEVLARGPIPGYEPAAWFDLRMVCSGDALIGLVDDDIVAQATYPAVAGADDVGIVWDTTGGTGRIDTFVARQALKLDGDAWVISAAESPSAGEVYAFSVAQLGTDRERPQSVSHGLPTGSGTRLPVVTSSGIQGSSITLTIDAQGPAEVATLDRLLMSDETLLIRGPVGHAWYAQVGDKISDDFIRAAPGPGDMGPVSDWRRVSVSFTQVARPGATDA